MFKKDFFLATVLFISGILSSQRFFQIPISSNAFLIPYILFMYYHGKEKNKALTCLILSMFFSVDNGAQTYTETNIYFLNLLYLSSFISILSSYKLLFSASRLCLFISFFTIIMIGTMDNFLNEGYTFNFSIFKRDIMLLLLISIGTIQKKKNLYFLGNLIFIGIIGYLHGEIINLIFFFKKFNDYLSYDTTKAFLIFILIFQSIYMKNKNIWHLYYFVMVCLVLVAYGSRMLIVSTLFLLTFSLIKIILTAKRKKIFFLTLSILVSVFLIQININTFAGIRSLSFFFEIYKSFSEGNINHLIKIVDPVRYGEHLLFFDRGNLNILFGKGLGSGLHDYKGFLAGVTPYQTAFSMEELQSSIFYNFHDIWLDIGLRFGLILPLIFIYYFSIREILFKDSKKGLIIGILLINTTFSTLGLLFTIMVMRFFPNEEF